MKTLLSLSLSCLAFAAAAVPLKWTVDARGVVPAAFEVVRGETIELEAALNSYGKPLEMAGKDVAIYWQTNGMLNAWWSAPATAASNTVAAVFTPAMDPGAAAVNGFIGVRGENYRAAFVLRFRHGPGEVPNELELPRKSIDFSTVEVSNAPWAAQAEVAALAGSVDEATNWISRVEAAAFVATQDANDAKKYADDANTTASSAQISADKAQTSADKAQTTADNAQAAADEAAKTAEAATNEVQAVKEIVVSWNGFLDGSNVWFTITNYISGAYSTDVGKLKIKELVDGEEKIIYDSRQEILAHLENYRDSVIKPLIDEMDAACRAAIAGKADKAWQHHTSAGADAPASNTVYITAASTVFGAGLEFERVEVGEGAISVLAARGAAHYTAGSEGTFRFYDLQRENYFGYSSTASYTLGVDASQIVAEGGLVELHIPVVMSGYPCVYWSPELFPGIMSGYEQWTQLNSNDGSALPEAPFAVTWELNPPEGEEVCYLNVGDEPMGFFIFTVDVAGSASFETNMPADFKGGILCTNGINRVAIDWNDGSPRLIEVK